MEIEELQGAQAMFTVISQMILAEPEDAEITSYAEQDLFAGAPFGTDDPEVVKGFELVRDWLKANVAGGSEDLDPENVSEAMNALRRDWLQLLVGVGAPKAPSWAGYYLSNTHGVISAETLPVRRFYRRYGFQLADHSTEPDDHLSIMMGFMAYLIQLELDGKDTVDDQKWLLEDRILPWLPAWLYAMDKYAKTDYFRGLGYATFGLFCAYAARFGIRYDEEQEAFFRHQG